MNNDKVNHQKDILETLEIVDILESIVEDLNEEESAELKDAVLELINSDPIFFISEENDSSENYHIYIKFDDCSDYLLNLYFEEGSIFMKRYLNDHRKKLYWESCESIALEIMNFLMSKYDDYE